MITTVSVLDREMFTESEAARLLRVPQSTLHYWLDGGSRGGVSYRPVLRVEPRHDRVVTWAEFVEAALLREYRRAHRVPMKEMRRFIELLRSRSGVPYPLATRRPLVMDRQLVREIQDEAGLGAEYCLVAEASGQLILTRPAEAYLHRVRWDADVAAGWRPHDDPSSPVVIDPEVRFGKPSVNGISTAVLREHDAAGEDVDEIAAAFGLAPTDVRWALAYENSAESPRAA